MDRSRNAKQLHVSAYTVQAANSKVVSSKKSSSALSRAPAAGKFVSRDEIKAAFKSAAQKLKNA